MWADGMTFPIAPGHTTHDLKRLKAEQHVTMKLIKSQREDAETAVTK